MATKKKSTAKKAATAPRGNTYQLTASGKKHLADVSGQGALIRDCLSKHGPITASQIAERLGKATNPKNVAFYLCIWKGDGHVAFGKKSSK